jgi:hypothetical protein
MSIYKRLDELVIDDAAFEVIASAAGVTPRRYGTSTWIYIERRQCLSVESTATLPDTLDRGRMASTTDDLHVHSRLTYIQATVA